MSDRLSVSLRTVLSESVKNVPTPVYNLRVILPEFFAFLVQLTSFMSFVMKGHILFESHVLVKSYLECSRKSFLLRQSGDIGAEMIKDPSGLP